MWPHEWALELLGGLYPLDLGALDRPRDCV
jgi:hypothetical protein